MITKETILKVINTKRFVGILSSALSLAGGGAAGYFFAKKRLEQVYAALSEQEIEEARRYYEMKTKSGEYSDPATLAEVYKEEKPDAEAEALQESIQIMTKKGYVSYDKIETSDSGSEEIHLVKNIFTNENPVDEDNDEFDLDAEMIKKEQGIPYVLKQEDYLENDIENTQSSLTWYEEDSVLVDERDQPIRNVEGVIGGEQNLKFGCGSKDKNVVYIRNDRFSADYEVVRSNGSYTEQVLGILEHSDRRRIRKFRNRD